MRAKVALAVAAVATPSIAHADPITAAIFGSAFAATFAGAVVSFIITTVLTLAATMLINALFAPKPSEQDRQASIASLNVGETPRVALFGKVLTGGTLCDAGNYGGTNGTDWEVLIIAIADHKCAGLEGYYVDDNYIAFTASGTQPGYNGQLVLHWLDGAATQTLPSIVTNLGWSTTGNLGGVACVVVAYKADAPQARDPVWSNRPSFKFVVKGKLCYDPRKDSSVGGSGAHRWSTPSTWEWTENLSVCRYNWVRGVYAKDQVTDPAMLLVGRGLSSLEAPEANVFAYANTCDETVALAGGGTQKRYTFNGVVMSNESYLSVERRFATACGGMIIQPGGSVEVEPGQARSVTATFSDDDIVVGSTVKWQPFRSQSDREWLNTVVPRYIEPAQNWTEHAAPVRRVVGDLTADKGPRETTLVLPDVTNGPQAQRVGEITRRLGRLVASATLTLPPRFATVTEGDWVQWTSARRFGGATRTFRVEAYSLDEKWQNTLSLREIAASCFSWSASDQIADSADATQTTAPSASYDDAYDPLAITTLASPVIEIAVDPAGTPLTDELPRRVSVRIYRGATAIKLENDTDFVATFTNVTGTIDTTDGSPTKGDIVVTAISANEGYADVVATVAGVAQPSIRYVYQKVFARETSTGGVGAKVASDSTLNAISLTSFVQVSDTLTVTLAGGERLVGSGSLDYYVSGSTAATRSATVKWGYRTAGSGGGFTDFGTAITGSAGASGRTVAGEWFEAEPGHVDANQAVTGLSAGNYEVALFASASATGRTLSWDGTARIEAKP